jgi:hypothetical protein
MGFTIYVSVMAHHTPVLILMGHFKSLSQINTSPVPIVLSIDTPTQMELSFISEKCKFWVENIIMYCLQNPIIKVVLSFELVLFYVALVSMAFYIVYFLFKKDPVESIFSPT